MRKQTISALNKCLGSSQLKLYGLSCDSLVLDQSPDGLKTVNNPLMSEMEILWKENAKQLKREL